MAKMRKKIKLIGIHEVLKKKFILLIFHELQFLNAFRLFFFNRFLCIEKTYFHIHLNKVKFFHADYMTIKRK